MKTPIILTTLFLSFSVAACDVEDENTHPDPAAETGGEAEADVEDGNEPEVMDHEMDLSTTEAPVTEANSADRLDACKWRKGTGTSVSDFKVACWDGEKVISGGCYHNNASVPVIRSHPYEANNGKNLPDDGDAWYGTWGSTGWRCKYDGGTGVNDRPTAVALCCGVGTPPPTPG